MTTAFQGNAFQNNAFQIDGSPTPSPTGGHYLPQYRGRYKKRPPGNIALVYEKAKQLPSAETRKLLSSVDPFVDPETPEELENRQSAKYISDSLPSISRIDYSALEANALAYKRFKETLDDIQQKMESAQKNLTQENDELLLITILACTIN